LDEIFVVTFDIPGVLMNLEISIALFISWGIVVGSIILPRIGFNKSSISRRGAAILSGIGVGFGSGIFIFYSVSNGDFIGSLFVAIVAGLVAGITVYFVLGKN
jgi:hypothetical protein